MLKRVFSVIQRSASLNVSILDFELENPVMPAAGPPVHDGPCMIECAEAGVGAMVAKTISVLPANVPRPCIIKTNKTDSMLNHELHSDEHYDIWFDEYYPMITENYPELPFFCSAGYGREDIEFLAPLMIEAGADIIELSIHHMGDPPTGMTKEEATLQEMEQSVKVCKDASAEIPVFPKYSPYAVPVGDFAKRALDAGADGIVACNSLGPCLEIDINTRQPVTGGPAGSGWLSGEMLKPIALQQVFELYYHTGGEVPIIGIGGIFTGEDVIEYIMSGATAVGICTAAIFEGPGCYTRVVGEIEAWMEEHGVENLEEIYGVGADNMIKTGLRSYYLEDVEDKTPQPNHEYCIKCGRCFKTCHTHKAISWEKKEFPTFDEDKCYRCGLCTSVCPNEKALHPIPFWE